jgi:hypothetical protein
LNFLEALRALERPENRDRGIRHVRWSPGVRVRWNDDAGWRWSTAKFKGWEALPFSAFFDVGIMGAPNLLADGWEVA